MNAELSSIDNDLLESAIEYSDTDSLNQKSKIKAIQKLNSL